MGNSNSTRCRAYLCNNHKPNKKDYCRVHKCRADKNCNKQRTDGDYCIDHTCRMKIACIVVFTILINR